MLKLPGGTIRVLVEGLGRAQITDFIENKSFFEVEAEEIEDDNSKSAEMEALVRHVLFQFEQYSKLSKKISPEILSTVSEIEEPGRLADVVASHLSLKLEQKQGILEAVSPQDRLEYLAGIFSHEMEILELEKRSA